VITIVDYGLGNVRAFLNMYKRLNIEARAVQTAEELADASRLILPGVGHFDQAMERLDASGMRQQLDTLVRDRKVPVLGVCVGMQMLAMSSEEGRRAGLGWIPGRVKALSSVSEAAKLNLPHMGWNDVRPASSSRLFDQLDHDARFYFLHSYYFDCDRASDVAATSSYGLDFSCAVSSENVHGVQFHPEKSHEFGTRLLKNFATI
jgi:glutamine amidotransferase